MPQRNELCWCGSGAKYKRCHESQDQETLKLIREKQQAAQTSRSLFN
ncbi:SEC-C metal-binding domain-containing protein [Malonomonas rubra]